jgi:tRNA nucleotidyltransferase (CCA-adding enzyme)
MTSQQLTANLAKAPIPRPVLAVVSRLRERGFQAFLVGGCVRDLVLGLRPKDYDVATDALPDQVERIFPRVIPTGKQHGTVTVLSQGTRVEVTTFRTEGEYLDARRPSRVEFRTRIEEDLSRRDFTINAMAFDPVDGRLCDPFGGQADLRARIVRCVGDPKARFSEDGLRSLRAVRLAAVLGFEIDPDTERALPASLPSFQRIAAERIRDEFCKLLLSARPSFGLELLRRTGLLAIFLPELLEGVGQAQGEAHARDVYGHVLATVEACRSDLHLRLGALLHDIAKPRTAVQTDGQVDFAEHATAGAILAAQILERLKLPGKVIEGVSNLVRYHQLERIEGAPDGVLRRFIASVGAQNVELHFALGEANRRGRGRHVQEELEKLRQSRSRVEGILESRPVLEARALALDGNAIMRVLGVAPSPLVGDATRFLMEQVLDNPDLNSPEKLAALLRSWQQSAR